MLAHLFDSIRWNDIYIYMKCICRLNDLVHQEEASELENELSIERENFDRLRSQLHQSTATHVAQVNSGSRVRVRVMC